MLINSMCLPTEKKLPADSETCCDLHHKQILLIYLSASNKRNGKMINKWEGLLAGWSHSVPHSCFRKTSILFEWSTSGQSLLLTIISISKSRPISISKSRKIEQMLRCNLNVPTAVIRSYVARSTPRWCAVNLERRALLRKPSGDKPSSRISYIFFLLCSQQHSTRELHVLYSDRVRGDRQVRQTGPDIFRQQHPRAFTSCKPHIYWR